MMDDLRKSIRLLAIDTKLTDELNAYKRKLYLDNPTISWHSMKERTFDYFLDLGYPLKEKLLKLSSDKKRIEYLANATAEITGLKDFPKYLTLIFEVDSLFLNDDRHLNNIAVIEKGGKFSYCPIFDNE